MAGLLIDTSVLIDVERGENTLDTLPDDVAWSISVVTASELLHGVHRARSEQLRIRRQAFVEGVLSAIAPLPVTEQVARVHAEIWASLESSGQMIGSHDLWIAATALSNDLAVATSNPRDFERVPGLDVLSVPDRLRAVKEWEDEHGRLREDEMQAARARVAKEAPPGRRR